jgi:AcrR family transcriptional regulator
MTTATLSRKQREIQQREALFLDVAERLLLERGYLGLNMDRVAELTEYSKGTLYQHFTCKEDLIAGVLIRTMEARERLFAKAATFHGRSRERLTAIGVADQVHMQCFPDHARIERITKVESIWDKASPERRQRFKLRDDNCLGIVMGIIRDGVASGDLALREGLMPEGLMVGVWSMAVGMQMLITFGILDDMTGFDDAIAVQNRNYQIFIDGYGWKPLSTEWDYAATVERVQAELFAAELGHTGAR